MVAELTCLGRSVGNSNSSGKTAAIVEARTCLTGPWGCRGTEVAATSRQKRRQRSELGLAETAGCWQGNRNIAETTMASANI